MVSIIKVVEFPIGTLKIGDRILFKEISDKHLNFIGKQECTFEGTIKSFEIGTYVLQGTHEILVCCENIKFISSSNPMAMTVGRETITKTINDYKNLISLLT